MRPLRPSHALFSLQLLEDFKEMKRLGFFKNAYRNVCKAYFVRRTTQSEFCFETNILCDRIEEDSTSNLITTIKLNTAAKAPWARVHPEDRV